jgi:glycerophosphoryl diester phosphodiesterase
MLSRRTLLSLPALALHAAEPIRLIAHRGGIVDDQHAENSPASLQDAIAAGYWMVEVDVRRTKDGEAILQHDSDFRRFYNQPYRVEELTWDEIRRFRAQPGNSTPLHFRDLCQLCRGKVRLMLDLKGSDWPAAFYENLATLLADHDLLRTAYLLGGRNAATLSITQSAKASINSAGLTKAIAAGEDVANRYYLFELASDITAATVAACRNAQIPCVAAINTFRYTMAKRDEWEGPKEDTARLLALGVTHFQIDSRYGPLFPPAISRTVATGRRTP